MQYLKEHLKKVHRKADPRDRTSWQCNRCQEVFQTQQSLEHHEINVDCNIRCAICRPEVYFSTKAERQVHSHVNHPKRENLSSIREIDEELNSKLKSELRAYTDALKRGHALDDALRQQWIVANTEKYVNSQSGVNAALELGQWYIMYKTLFPKVSHPSHPFYENDIDAVPEREIVQEKVFFIWDTLLNVHIAENGPPPTSFQANRDFYADHLRNVMGIAAETRLVRGCFGNLLTSFNDIVANNMAMDPAIGVLPPADLLQNEAFNAQVAMPDPLQRPMNPSGYDFNGVALTSNNYQDSYIFDPLIDPRTSTTYPPV
ncbi:hypothetical protein BR93DRAFT_981094 [Coniochaeta sp. PMI_546]|nr:hypothetical protein BR93DRAFT_981094 [Coniochaeta sp. PMI_546]